MGSQVPWRLCGLSLGSNLGMTAGFAQAPPPINGLPYFTVRSREFLSQRQTKAIALLDGAHIVYVEYKSPAFAEAVDLSLIHI